MADPVVGLQEMARVTRGGGVIVACVWDHAGGRGPLSLFWSAVRELDPGADDESKLAGSREGHLAELFEAAGLRDVDDTALSVRVDHASFEEWWEPYTLGVGPAGAYVARSTRAAATSSRSAAGSSRRRRPSRSTFAPGRRAGTPDRSTDVAQTRSSPT